MWILLMFFKQNHFIKNFTYINYLYPKIINLKDILCIWTLKNLSYKKEKIFYCLYPVYLYDKFSKL